ncbi:hypothetical protein EDD11_006840 [Mortierella claussenii]|nr:hypothetical protein EDD11_006840 [Mortierella claussenii]
MMLSHMSIMSRLPAKAEMTLPLVTEVTQYAISSLTHAPMHSDLNRGYRIRVGVRCHICAYWFDFTAGADQVLEVAFKAERCHQRRKPMNTICTKEILVAFTMYPSYV